MALSPRWQANFPAVANGQLAETTAVAVTGATMVVAVSAAAADANLMDLDLQIG